MTHETQPKPRVFVDADVLFAGAASPREQGASLVILRLGEFTLLDAITSEQVITEAERNLADKLPAALPLFRVLVGRCLHVVSDSTCAEIASCARMAHPKDLPILVAAVREGCPWLVTFNTRDYEPGHPRVEVLRPGAFLSRVRDVLTHLAARSTE